MEDRSDRTEIPMSNAQWLSASIRHALADGYDPFDTRPDSMSVEEAEWVNEQERLATEAGISVETWYQNGCKARPDLLTPFPFDLEDDWNCPF